MTTRLRTANLEQETNFDEGVGELSVEEKYAEVKQLIIVGKEKGFLLYDEVQQDIIAASSGIVDKTNDPVRMYLREMGTVKLLDRQGEVDIAKRIEKGERKVYKALSQNRIILEEILKIFESAKKDTRVIKEMIDLAMPEDDGEPDVPGEPKMPASAINKINDIMAIFEKVARLDKRIKDQKAKLVESKKLSQRQIAMTQRTIDRLEQDLATELRLIDFTPQTRNRMINKLKDIDSELS